MKKLTNQKFLRNTLHQFGFYTKKNLGQNFLIDDRVLETIIESAEITSEDHVIEIGPGPGVITQAMVETGANITALEIDEKVIPILKYTTQNAKNLTILNQNALTFQPDDQPYILCANIPYYITSPILNHYLGGKQKPKRVIILMQKEVAQKICCKPKDMSTLSIQVHIYGKPEIVQIVKEDSFFPEPKVESAVLKITTYDTPRITIIDKQLFWKIIHHCFQQRRKKILNTLSSFQQLGTEKTKEILEESSIDTNARPQTLSIEQWNLLSENISKQLSKTGKTS